MPIDNEVEVGRDRIKAGHRPHAVRRHALEVRRDERPIDLIGRDFSREALGRNLRHAAARGKAVDAMVAVLQLPDPHRQFVVTCRFEPILNLPRHAEKAGNLGGQPAHRPGPRGDHRPRCGVFTAIGHDLHLVARLVDALDTLTELQPCSVSRRQLELRAHARLWTQQSSVRLEVTVLVVAHVEHRKTPTDGLRVEQLVRDSEPVRRGERVFEEVGDVDLRPPPRARDPQAAGDLEQALACRLLDFAPQLVGAQHQRHVLLAFTDRLANDAGLAAVRAAIVRRCEAVDPEDPLAALGELVGGRASDRAKTHDDRVENHACEYSCTPGAGMSASRIDPVSDSVITSFASPGRYATFVSVDPAGLLMKCVTSPRAFSTKAPPRLASATTTRLSTSTARPSGPLAPKKVRNAPTFERVPCASNGTRHTALARVTAAKSALPEMSSAWQLGLRMLDRRQSSCPDGRRR